MIFFIVGLNKNKENNNFLLYFEEDLHIILDPQTKYMWASFNQREEKCP